MVLRPISVLTISLAGFLLLSACVNTVSNTGPTASAGEAVSEDPNTPQTVRNMPPAVMTIPGLPVPDGATVVLGDTIIVGKDNEWTGQVVMTSEEYHTVQLVAFMRNEMPNFGWQETSIIQSARTSITFVKEDRLAVVRIMDRDGIAEMDVVVAPATTNSSGS